MTGLHSDIEGSLSTSISPMLVVVTVVFLAMVAVVGYLAWKNRKKVLHEQRSGEEQK